jgi:hypothetical protein
VISSTGKIWGGKALNNFRIKDEHEAEALLAGGVTAAGSNAAPATAPAAAAEVDASHPASEAREEPSTHRVGEGQQQQQQQQDPPINSFTFSSKRQEELLSDPSRIFSDGHKSSGGIDRKIVAPKIYLRKATSVQCSAALRKQCGAVPCECLFHDCVVKNAHLDSGFVLPCLFLIFFFFFFLATASTQIPAAHAHLSDGDRAHGVAATDAARVLELERRRPAAAQALPLRRAQR